MPRCGASKTDTKFGVRVLAWPKVVVQSVGMESDATPVSTYVPIAGSHVARTQEELAEVFAGFPERIVELREQKKTRSLSPAEAEELRSSEALLTRSAPWLLPPG